MSITNEPAASATRQMEQIAPTPRPEDKGRRIWLWVILGVLAFLAFGVILAVALIAGGSSTDETPATQGDETTALSTADDQPEATTATTGQADTATTAPATSAPVASTTATNTPAATAPAAQPVPAELTGPFVDPSLLLLAFADAWNSADWTRMETMAADNVIAVAKEWYDEAGGAEITTDNIDFIVENCTSQADGNTSCQFLYAPESGFGLIFDAIYATTEDGVMMVDLVFGGDAG